MSETRIETPLLIAFLDLTRFFAQIQRTDDAEIAETLDAFYEHVAAAVGAAGGTVVKFIGDAALWSSPSPTWIEVSRRCWTSRTPSMTSWPGGAGSTG
jgi:hypothetical protein